MDAGLAVDTAVLTGALLLLLGAVLSGAAERFRTPGLLVVLALGMVIGDDGLALIRFDNPNLAQSIGVIALIVILFEGGLSSDVQEARAVLAPAVAMATFGVAATAAVVTGAVVVFSDNSVTTAMLIGAVVASTDAAAVFAVLRKTSIGRRLTTLLETESGANDPMAVLLTVGVLASWSGNPSAADWILFGTRQLFGGLLVGAIIGSAALAGLRRVSQPNRVLLPIMALASAGLAYGIATALGASGFLAVYISGVLIGTTADASNKVIVRFHEALAGMAQIGLFLMLGLLVFPSRLPSVAAVGVIVAAALILVARPLAVALCVPWFGFNIAESTFVAWAGLRGAVPIVLATFPLTAGYPDGEIVFDVVFFVVLASATVQGLTIGPVGSLLGLDRTEATGTAAR